MKATGVLLGFAGIGTIYFERLTGGGGTMLPFIFLLLSAFLWAVSIVHYKLISNAVNSYWISFSEVTIGSIVVLPLALATGGISFTYEPKFLFSIAYITILSTAVAFLSWFYLLEKEDATTVSSSSLMIPVIAFITGAIILGETINLFQVVGVTMVLAGIYLVNRKNKS